MKIDILNIGLVVQLGPYAVSKLSFYINSKANLDAVVEKSELERADDEGLLVEDLDETHENAWS